jgi:hypothetical protein
VYRAYICISIYNSFNILIYLYHFDAGNVYLRQDTTATHDAGWSAMERCDIRQDPWKGVVSVASS